MKKIIYFIIAALFCVSVSYATLHFPVPTGGTATNFVVLDSSGMALTDVAATAVPGLVGLTASVAEINTACDGITATYAELNKLDAVTGGVVSASLAVVVDANKDIGDFRNLDATNLDAGLSGTAGTVDIFPTTESKGKLSLSATDNAGDTTTAITNAEQAGARTYTIPDAGASAYFVMSTAAQSAAGLISRADLVENALAAYGVPINQIMAADGAALGITETAGDFYLNLGTNVIELRGEEAISETEASVGYIQFILPPEYVSAGDVKLRLRCQIDGAGTDNGSTLDIEAYEYADGAVGADLNTTEAVTFAAKTTYYNKDFTITAAGLVAGDILIIKVTSSVIESAGSALAFYSDPPKFLIDIKG